MDNLAEQLAAFILTADAEDNGAMPSGFFVILAAVVMIGLKKAWVRSQQNR